MISSMAHGQPARCTATMAFVRGVSAAQRLGSDALAVRIDVGHDSGTAPRITAQLAEAT